MRHLLFARVRVHRRGRGTVRLPLAAMTSGARRAQRIIVRDATINFDRPPYPLSLLMRKAQSVDNHARGGIIPRCALRASLADVLPQIFRRLQLPW